MKKENKDIMEKSKEYIAKRIAAITDLVALTLVGAEQFELLSPEDLAKLEHIHDELYELCTGKKEVKITPDKEVPLDLDEKKQFIKGREYYVYFNDNGVSDNYIIKVSNVFKDWYGDALVEVNNKTYKTKWDEKNNCHWFLLNGELVTSRALVPER